MKKRANWLLIPAVALGLGACDQKKQANTTGPAAVEVAETSPTAVTPAPKTSPAEVPIEAEVTAPAVGAAERAAKLGFAQYLPQDTEAVVAVYNGSKIAERVKNSRVWSLVQSRTGLTDDFSDPEIDSAEPMDPSEEIEPSEAMEPSEEITPTEEVAPTDPDDGDMDALPDSDISDDEEEIGPAALFGSEFTLALGKTTSEQASHLLTVQRRVTYFQMRNLVKSLAASVKSGEASSMQNFMQDSYSGDFAKEFFNDPKSGITLFEKAQMPPVYMAFRTTEATREKSAVQISSMLGDLASMSEPMSEAITLDADGFTFTGTKILGAKVAEMMAEDRESMDEELGAATVDQLMAAVAKKNLVVVSGVVGDYVLLFLGSDESDLKLAAKPADSLLGSDSVAFADGYLNKELAVVVHGSEQSLETLFAAMPRIGDIAEGMRDGLAASEGLGDTRDLEAMFQIVTDREAELRNMVSMDATGTVVFFEEGLKIECFGGTDNGMVDWKSPNQLNHLGDGENVVVFANMTGDAAYNMKSRAYVEALMETGYAVAMTLADQPAEDGEMGQFQEMAKMFDEKFRPDMVALWDALTNDFGDSLGDERALVIDLLGEVPAVPNISQEVLDSARMPRVTIISPVTDRAKLAGSWTKMNSTLTGTFAKISEISGTDMPMQKPMSSERNGNVTWFFPMPFLTDDFVPSVTVSDKWFAASTSKNQALDLMAMADTAKDPQPAPGVWINVNFVAMQKYAREMLKVAEANDGEIPENPADVDQKDVEDAVSLLDGLDKMTVHSRREASGLRTSVHFKTR